MTNLWNVSSELLQNCYQMSLDNDLTDVTFVTTDLDEVRAHKVILSAVSPYLKKMMHNIKKNYMPINTSMMKKLIEYMYTGYTRVHKDEIQKFLHHVENLQIILHGTYDVEETSSEMTEELQEDGTVPCNYVDGETQHISNNEGFQDDDDTIDGNDEETGVDMETQRETVKQFRCKYCEVVNDSLKSLRRHKKTVHKDKVGEFMCGTCGKGYSDRHTFHRHFASQHDIDKKKAKSKFHCDECDFKTVNKKYLQTHKEKKHANESARYECKSCESSYIYQSGLDKHMRQKHENESS